MNAEELYELAAQNYRQGYRDIAKTNLERALIIKPDLAKAYALRASIMADAGNTFDAVLNYDKAIAIDPKPDYINNKGAAQIDLDDWVGAEKSYRQTLEANPGFFRGWNNYGRLCLIFGRYAEAHVAFENAVKINPDYAEAHLGLAFLELDRGNLEKGWIEYEWRKKMIPSRYDSLDVWTGQMLEPGEAVLVCGEQGMGDVIQFCRYAPMIKAQFGGKVYVEVRPPLTRLIGSLPGIDGVITHGDDVPADVRYTVQMMSCPLIFGHYKIEDIPAQPPYLSPLPNRVASWLPYVNALRPGLPRVGFVWAGNGALPTTDKRRSTNLSLWTPLAKVPGLAWVSLQKGPAQDQLRTTQLGMTVLDVMKYCEDMADTAALIAHCDLVISVDTSVAHLAAAMGKPTWVLSRHDSCWRWLNDRRDSPWYPSVTHFRQKRFNDWPGLMSEVADELSKWAKDHESHQ